MSALTGLQRVRISRRLLIFGAAFTLPIAPMLVLLATSVNTSIDVANLELRGNAYQRHLEQLLQGVAEHQLMTAPGGESLSGNARSAADAETLVDRAFADLAGTDERIGASLQFTKEGLAARKREHVRVETVRDEWQQLAAHPSSDAADRHRHLIGDIRTMITHAGDTSNLILDPDLDSYYTMDATLLALPQTQDRITAIAAFAIGLGDRKTLTRDEQVKLAVFASSLEESDVARVGADVDTALNEDKNFYGVNDTLQHHLKPAADRYVAAARTLVTALRAASGAPANSADVHAVISAAMQAHMASFAAWGPAAGSLDALLMARREAHASTRAWMLGCATLAWLGALMVAFVISRSITGPLAAISDELGTGARQVSAAAGTVAESAQSLARGAGNQGASLEAASASMEQMATMTRANADQASEAARLMQEAHSVVDGSHKALGQMMRSMDGIRESSQMISRIIKTVNEIAFQTNLLALNAAVEAARAGSAGMGFAVVADEVRRLAQRSADAARSTESLIEDAIAKTQEGDANVEQVTESVRALVERVGKVKALIDQVSESSHQQAQGIGQVTAAITEIERITQAAAGTAEESAAASEQLTAHAGVTLATVVRLEEMLAGRAAHRHASGLESAAAPEGAPADESLSADQAA